jgi:protein SCO1
MLGRRGRSPRSRRAARAGLLLALAVGLALAALAWVNGGGSSNSYRGTAERPGIHLPSFSLRSETGQTVSSAGLRNRVTLMTFLDSKCTDSCPIVASVVAKAVDQLGTDRERVAALALTMNPHADTPIRVRRFLATHHATGRIQYLLGTVAALRPLWRRFLVLSSFESGDDDTHSDGVRVYDGRGDWVSTLRPGLDLTVANVVHDVRLALATNK